MQKREGKPGGRLVTLVHRSGDLRQCEMVFNKQYNRKTKQRNLYAAVSAGLTELSSISNRAAIDAAFGQMAQLSL